MSAPDVEAFRAAERAAREALQKASTLRARLTAAARLREAEMARLEAERGGNPSEPPLMKKTRTRAE